jgi:predicted RNA binding protein YcfA (HicA-like mRNA interferase family)
MPKFPVDAPKRKVIKTLESLGFRLVVEGNHVAMERSNPDGTRTPLTMPNHRTIKSSTLRTLIGQAAQVDLGLRRVLDSVGQEDPLPDLPMALTLDLNFLKSY